MNKMKKVFGIEMGKKKELLEVLEADPYAKDSFAMIGYKLKEGAQVGADQGMLYVYVSGDEESIGKAGKRLEGLLVEVPPETEEKIIAIITEEEDQAATGMGDIFG
jgi:hypothetical protein